MLSTLVGFLRDHECVVTLASLLTGCIQAGLPVALPSPVGSPLHRQGTSPDLGWGLVALLPGSPWRCGASGTPFAAMGGSDGGLLCCAGVSARLAQPPRVAALGGSWAIAAAFALALAALAALFACTVTSPWSSSAVGM